MKYFMKPLIAKKNKDYTVIGCKGQIGKVLSSLFCDEEVFLLFRNLDSVAHVVSILVLSGTN